MKLNLGYQCSCISLLIVRSFSKSFSIFFVVTGSSASQNSLGGLPILWDGDYDNYFFTGAHQLYEYLQVENLKTKTNLNTFSYNPGCIQFISKSPLYFLVEFCIPRTVFLSKNYSKNAWLWDLEHFFYNSIFSFL